MTLAQILMTIALVLGSQMAPRLIAHIPAQIQVTAETGWLVLVPPVWFSALDQSLIGRGSPTLWVLAAIGFLATAT